MEYKLKQRFSVGISASSAAQTVSLDRIPKFLTIITQGYACSIFIEFRDVLNGRVTITELENFHYLNDFHLKKAIPVNIQDTTYVAIVGTGTRKEKGVYGVLQITRLTSEAMLKTIAFAVVRTDLKESELECCRGFVDQLSNGDIFFCFSEEKEIFVLEYSDIFLAIEGIGIGEIEYRKMDLQFKVLSMKTGTHNGNYGIFGIVYYEAG